MKFSLPRRYYLFCGNHDAAVRAAIVYSLFTSCKAHGIDVRSWLEDTLKRITTEKVIDQLLPTTSRHYPVLPSNGGLPLEVGGLLDVFRAN